MLTSPMPGAFLRSHFPLKGFCIPLATAFTATSCHPKTQTPPLASNAADSPHPCRGQNPARVLQELQAADAPAHKMSPQHTSTQRRESTTRVFGDGVGGEQCPGAGQQWGELFGVALTPPDPCSTAKTQPHTETLPARSSRLTTLLSEPLNHKS